VNYPSKLSVVITVVDRGERASQLHEVYSEILSEHIADLEFIYVIVPRYRDQADLLMQRQTAGQNITVVQLNRDFGEATALLLGVKESSHEFILTLPAFEQVEPASLLAVFASRDDADIIDVRRYPRRDGLLNQVRSRCFGSVLKILTGTPVGDPGCVVRLARREVYDNLRLYGDLHRFISVLAIQEGYSVLTIDCPQSIKDRYRRSYSITTYLARGLDMVTAMLLTRYRQKPLRFFGVGGFISAFIGCSGLLYLAYERIFEAEPVADRPLLLGFSIFLLLGIQLLAIGLVGETVIFTNSGSISNQRVKKVVRKQEP
jgi:hypothetical protein